MNIGHFAGRAGQDAEIRYTPGGKAVASFSIAIDQGKNTQNEKRPPLWVKATLWEKKAEALAQYIHKGDMVIVAGPVSIEQWTTQNNEQRAQIVVTVRDFTFGGSAKGSDGGEQRPSVAQPPAFPAPISDDDIPF